MINNRFISFLFLFFLVIKVHAQDVTRQDNPVIESIHGKIDLQEPILQELLASPVMQRLKHIQQYGTYSISHPFKDGKVYTRYIHSLGVMKMVQLAKEKGANITLAQIVAALLHDCSHTAFSHCSEPLFMDGNTNKNYQDRIHAKFIKERGILEIVEKYGLSLEDILPDNPDYKALEQPAPTLCADRLEYNLYSGYLTGLLTEEDRQAILEDIHFDNEYWFFTKPDLALKLAQVSLHDTLYTYSSPSSLLTSIYTSEALKHLIDQKKISLEDVRYNKTDDEIWDFMIHSTDPEVQLCVKKILNIDKTYKIVSRGEHDLILKGRFSGLDPFIKIEGKMVKLTEYNPEYAKEFTRIKEIKKEGWPIKFITLNE